MELKEGKKFDEGKPRLDLIAPELNLAVGGVLTFGANKYGPRNWEKGFNWGRASAALERHMTAWQMGEDIDPESGLSHLDHAACNIMFLIAFANREIGVDDRSPYFKQEKRLS